MTTDELKAKAHDEIQSIEDAAVREYLLLKAGSYSLKTVLIVAAAAFVLGILI